MTCSEQICQEINRKFYFDDFVLTNLFYTKDGIKMEICDGLIEFQDIYIILQIKEKAANNDTDENNIKWLSKKVYKKAVSQIKDTIRILQNESSLVVEDMYGQTVEIDNSKKIIPVIIFKADDISEYRKVYHSATDNININVFSVKDYQIMMDILKMPLDITEYLGLRAEIFETSNIDIIIDDSDENWISMGQINSETDFANYFICSRIRDNSVDAIYTHDFLNIISKYHSKRTNNDPNYKQILNRMLCFDRLGAKYFMERWNKCWDDAKNNILRYQYRMVMQNEYEKFGFLFISAKKGIKEDCSDFYIYIGKLFVQKYELDTAIIIINYYEGDGNFYVNWIMLSKPYSPDQILIQDLKELNLWNGDNLIQKKPRFY